jgi:peptide/histidine transporter 3/4
VYSLFTEGYNQNQWKHPFNENWTGAVMWCMALLFPIGGWLADTRVGRYKVIHYSIWIMWTGMVLATLVELLLSTVGTNCPKNIKNGAYLTLGSFTAIGLSGFLSNIIHLGVDQLIDASASEITSFISWYTVTLYASGFIFHFITDCFADTSTFYIKIFFVAVCLTVALCLDFLFHRTLVHEPVVHRKSLRVILGVIKYTIRNRHLRYSLSATANNVIPSRFEVAKHMHGGPFTSQQVDNVRTFLWVLIIIAVCSLVFGSFRPLHYVQEKIEHHWTHGKNIADKRVCYKSLILLYNDQLIVIAVVILYEFIVHPLFYRCLPKLRITSRFLLAIVSFLLWILSLSISDAAMYHPQSIRSNDTSESLHYCILVDKVKITISYKLLLVPSFLDALSHFLLVSSALEYIWAQTPSTMKGLMLGFAYMFLGLSTLVHSAILYPFSNKKWARRVSWQRTPLQCEVWFFILEGTIVLAVLFVTSILVKKRNKQKDNKAYVYSSRE